MRYKTIKSINVLVTGGGAPGISGTLFSLKNNFDKRKIKIITTDVNENVVGRYLSDVFYLIPKAIQKEEYISALLDICKKEQINVLIPQNTLELEILARKIDLFSKLGTKVIINDLKTIITLNDKEKLMKFCMKLNVPVPQYYLVSNSSDLIKYVKELGYPEKPIIIKPPNSNGSRGLRIIDDTKDYKKAFYDEKPNNIYSKLNFLTEILGDNFAPLLVMEFLPGKEVSIDVFRFKDNFIALPRVREEIKSGISFKNIAFKSEELIDYCNIISEKLNLKYCYGFQFKLSSDNKFKILECNPRVQGTMVFSTFAGVNLIYLSVKAAMGESFESGQNNIDWETKLFRYWGAIGINSNGIKII